MWQKNIFTKGPYQFISLIEKVNYLIKSTANLPFYFFKKVNEYKNLQIKYQKALEELETYKSQKEKYEILLEENKKLRNLLNFSPLEEYQEIKAKVLGIRLNSLTPIIIINKGKKQNVKPFMPVITYTNDENNSPIRAVVGITSIIEDNLSIILPLQNPQIKLGVKITKTDQWAILEGNSFSFNRLRLKYISYLGVEGDTKVFKDSTINIQNTRVVTSGNDGIFPPNIPVGRIVNISENLFGKDFFYVLLEPYVKIDKLEYVTIILKDPDEWKNYVQSNEAEFLKTPFSDEKPPENLKINEEKTKMKVKEEKEEARKQKTENQKQENIEKNIPVQKQNIINPNDPLNLLN